MNEQLLIAEEVAELLRVPEEHVYRLARRGEITSIRIGRYVRFTATDVTNYIKQNMTKAAS